MEFQSVATQKSTGESDIDFAKCECCGLTEECTPAYISGVRARYEGRWICGLCSEAVEDEIVRSERPIGTEEALNRHVSFCTKFRFSSPPANPTEDLISAMKQLFRRSLDSPRSLTSSPTPPSVLVQSESCCSVLDG
ncbi:uncharacterized protein LOC132308096 [Cornus florida]|uniref:uncharacterized protein LOC132308096 n=1 Tax=Cornus florida TaxID=4283 RepID=UPI00289DA816|nr:uncharacterized protein LOC132308096 [Cornus florida]